MRMLKINGEIRDLNPILSGGVAKGCPKTGCTYEKIKKGCTCHGDFKNKEVTCETSKLSNMESYPCEKKELSLEPRA